MMPFLFEIGPIRVPSYGFMLMTAFAVNYFLLLHELKRKGKSPELAADIVFWATVGGILGSKIYYAIERGAGWENIQALGNLIAGVFSFDGGRISQALAVLGAGLVFFGGLLGGLISVTILLKRRGESWLLFANILAPLLILGYAIGRIGCFLVGDDYGTASQLPWAIAFPKGIPPTTTPVHPTQLYETTMGLIIFVILWKLRTRTRPGEMLFFIYLVLAGTERFFIEFIRTNTEYLLGLTGAQIVSLVMIAL
ncbi:MAG: prolipoprotein diacylglyceryl transferase, partial [Candidatus Neomarinimicrobiota bacterium]